MSRKHSACPNADLLADLGTERFACILADPPWQFINRTGKMAPEHKRLSRYGDHGSSRPYPRCRSGAWRPIRRTYTSGFPMHCCPKASAVMAAWGFKYKSNIIWHKIRKDGGSDGRGVGFYFRNVTEILLFGVKGKNARTLKPGRTQVKLLGTRKREHSRKPDEIFDYHRGVQPGAAS